MRACVFVCGAVGILFAVSTLRGEPGKARETATTKEVEKALYDRLEDYGMLGGSQFGYEIWVLDVKDHRLLQPVFIHLDARGGNDKVITAKEAELKVDTGKSQLVVKMREGVVSTRDGSKGNFQERKFTVALPVSKDHK
jgi:hypothetical protein